MTETTTPNPPAPPLSTSVRDHLRALPSLVGRPPGFDAAFHPETPHELFLDWLHAAEEAGIPEPHAMTVSTVDAEGIPDARLLVLKDLTADGAWCFAGKRDSTKGSQLAAHPAAALTFYWREHVRSVRIRGPITEAPDSEARRDFTARHLDARAIALSGRQSIPLDSADELDRSIAKAHERLREEPGAVPETWTLWQLRPLTVEFWEGSKTRLHTRLRYERTSTGWRADELRP